MVTTRVKMRTVLILLFFFYSQTTILAQVLVSKNPSNSTTTAIKTDIDIENGQSTRETQLEISRPEQIWIVAREISCWEQNGRWEEEQVCPPSKIVTAHRFRYLSRTGLTGIELKCTHKFGPDQSQSQTETKSERILRMDFEDQVEKNLPRGGWGNWRSGNRSAFAEGFSFSRGELSLRRSVKNYDVIYHKANHMESTVNSDLDLNLDFVRVIRKCPEDHAICGVTAMMDEAKLGILTAIGLKCCHYCVPEEKWVTFYQFDNTSPSEEKREVSTTFGAALEPSSQNRQPNSVNLRPSLGSIEVARLFARLGKSNSTGFDWTRTPFSIWTDEDRVTETYLCKAQSSCVYKQLVGQCGNVRVPVDKLCQVSFPLGSPIPTSCNFNHARSCSDAMEFLPSSRSEKQTIYPHGNNKSLAVLCDFESDGGGWTLIQKRSSGPKQQFQKNWNKYSIGFGSLNGNFWLGLENIHALTKNGDQELRIELEDFEGNKKYAKYSSFSVSDAADFYRLNISGFSGDSRDSLTYNNGMRFSTKDNDNDNWSGGDCVAEDGGGGGWWFSDCGWSSLNGLYFEKGETVPYRQGIYWYSWKGASYSLAKTEMKIRKRK